MWKINARINMRMVKMKPGLPVSQYFAFLVISTPRLAGSIHLTAHHSIQIL
jgi:hypothetical protein